MKPLFTIHAGEYLVGEYIERHFKQVNVWLPARDTGIDLLISDLLNRRVVSIQVKYLKDFLPSRPRPSSSGAVTSVQLWKIDREKLRTSRADLWVFVLPGFAGHTLDFLLVPPKELDSRWRAIFRQQKVIQSYLRVSEERPSRCW
jgi:hypothetical protein